MSYEQDVKEIAYKLDPECWVSYSGKPRGIKAAMDARRSHALREAQKQYDADTQEKTDAACTVCGRN